MNKETIIGLIIIVAIVVVFLSIGYIKEKSQAGVSIIKSEGIPGVSVLLLKPEYGTEVKVYGNVSALGELLCTCFVLTSVNYQ